MDIRRIPQQSITRSLLYGMIAVFISLCFFTAPPTVFGAGLILGAELKLTYEDNVVGLLSDQGGRGSSGSASGSGMGMAAPMGGPRYLGSGSGSNQSPGDFSATLSAEAGGYQDIAKDAFVFAKVFAEHQSYDTYTDLNSNIGGVSVGVNTNLNDTVSARAALLGKIKRFGDGNRDSTSLGGTVSLKEKLMSSFWLREFGEYEKNNADTSTFSFRGTKIGIDAGYALFKETLVTFGYNYLDQQFDEPADADMKTNTVYAGIEQMFRKNWSVAGEYDLQVAKENVTGSSTTDNVFSLALRYSY